MVCFSGGREQGRGRFKRSAGEGGLNRAEGCRFFGPVGRQVCMEKRV